MTPVIRPLISTPNFKNMLIDRLPRTRGRLTPNTPLGHLTWLGVGGPAEVLYKPADREDLISFVANCAEDIPITVMGSASNTIIRDGGIPGVVVRLGLAFTAISAQEERISAGAGAFNINVVLAAAEAGIAGLEFLSTIPGGIGGALCMNAGYEGAKIKDVLVSADVLFRDGEVKTLSPADMDMSRRRSALPRDAIFLSGLFKGAKDSAYDIHQRINQIKQARAFKQPIKTHTGGATFSNPDAAALIEQAGCGGLKIGGAALQGNLMSNTAQASAADLERLGEEARNRVLAKTGAALDWEIKRLGVPLEKDQDILEFMKEGERKK